MSMTPQKTYEVSLSNREKRFRELIVYIANKCSENVTFGSTVLNKILWASDFMSFQTHRIPVTGEKYQRLEHGPAPLRMVPVRDEMVRDGDIYIKKTLYRGKPQNRIIALRDADLSVFSAEDIAIVDETITYLGSKTGTAVSNWSHMRAWKTHQNGQLIPYEAVYLSDDGVSPSDLLRTEELAQKFNWHDLRTAA